MIRLKFGLWQAAFLFKETGQDIYKILEMLKLSVAEWNHYSRNYCYFFQIGNKGMSSLSIFDIKEANDKLNEFIQYFEDEYLPLRTDEDTLATFSTKVRKTILHNPHIGVFEPMPWHAVYIGGHSRIGPCMYTHDNEYVYCCGEKLPDTKGNTLEGVIADKFQILSRHFMSDGANIYREQKKKTKHDLSSSFMILSKADIDSFRTVGKYYGIDKNAVYHYSNKRVTSSSAKELKPIKQLSFNIRKEPAYNESEYAADLDNVYYKGKVISQLPNHFRQINESHYYTDGQLLFHKGKAIPEADLASFGTDDPHIDSRDFGSDKNNEYFGSKSYPLNKKKN